MPKASIVLLASAPLLLAAVPPYFELLSTHVFLKATLVLLAAMPLLLTVVPLAQLYAGASFDPARVRGQRVLVCGASGGIGEQIAYQYARLGAHVALVARRESELKAVAAEARRLGAASAHAVVGDMGSSKGSRDALEASLKALTDGYAYALLYPVATPRGA